MHPDGITDFLSKFSKRHGLPYIHPHTFRHTMASLLISEGMAQPLGDSHNIHALRDQQ